MQLAVLDVLYKNLSSQDESVEAPALTHHDEQVESVELFESDIETLQTGDDNDDLELDIVCENEDIDESLYVDRFAIETQLAPTDFDIIEKVPVDYQQTVERVRKVARLLKRSPTKKR